MDRARSGRQAGGPGHAHSGKAVKGPFARTPGHRRGDGFHGSKVSAHAFHQPLPGHYSPFNQEAGTASIT